jgi:hypothetical protein
VKDLAPLIVLSAAPRMGTTLVQRLLCSANDCLIYGDSVGNDAAFFLSWLSSKQFAIGQQAPSADPMLNGVLAGNTAEFIAELLPESGGYLASLTRMAAAPLAHCAAEARGHGRPIWGWKHAGAQAWLIGLLPAMLPKARVIRVERDLADTARSAKAARMIGPGEHFEHFVAGTVASRAALAGLSGRLPVFDLKLEDLVADPGRVVSDLEAFAGCSRIDRGVVAVKLNHPHSAWVPPVPLTGDEEALVRSFEPLPHHDLVVA